MNRLALLTALLLSTVSACALGQGVVMLNGTPTYSMAREVGAKESNAASGSDGSTNATSVNTFIAATTKDYAVFTEGGRWNFQGTVVGDRTGRRWTGNGLARMDASSSSTWSALRGPASQWVWNRNQIVLDGSTITASTANDSSATLTVNGGITLGASDATTVLRHTLRITGGTNFTTGTYAIVAASGNTLTLDRDPSTGGAGSAMVGVIQGTMFREEGFGAIYDGLNFFGSPNFPYDTSTFNSGNPANRCAIGLHFHPILGEGYPNTAKAHVSNCGFADFDVAILAGAGLDEIQDIYEPDINTGDYYSAAGTNADHVDVDNIRAESCGTVIAVRGSQSVGFDFDTVTAVKCKQLVYIERGGKGRFSGFRATSNGADGPTLLRIGGAANSLTVSSPITVTDWTLDDPCDNLKLLQMDGTGNPIMQIVIENGTINNPKKRTTATEGTGTAQSGTASTIVLASSTAQANDFYNGYYITITAGTGLGQVRGIEDYVGATDTVTVNVPWQVIPDSSSVYRIFFGEDGTHYDIAAPVVTATDGAFVTLRNVAPILPNWIVLSNSSDLAKPSVSVVGCRLIGAVGSEADIKDNPQTVVNLGASQTGTQIFFAGNTGGGYDGAGTTDYAGHKFCRSGIYEVGANWLTDETGFSMRKRRPQIQAFYAALGLEPTPAIAAEDLGSDTVCTLVESGQTVLALAGPPPPPQSERRPAARLAY